MFLTLPVSSVCLPTKGSVCCCRDKKRKFNSGNFDQMVIDGFTVNIGADQTYYKNTMWCTFQVGPLEHF